MTLLSKNWGEDMEKKAEVLYGYTILENEDRVAMLFSKRLLSEDSIEGWRIARVLQEVSNKIREEERERENDSGTD